MSYSSRALAPLLLPLLLAACGHGSAEKSGGADSQVVAKVNDKEISVHQLNLAMGNVPANLPPERLHEAAKSALDKLVDQEILAQQALADKLDRDPKVVQQLEAARQQTLARAWVEHSAQAISPPSKADVDAFYDQHPELFANRRIYRLQQLQLLAPIDATKLQGIVGHSKTLVDVSRELAAEKVGFNETTATTSPEQMPLKLASAFSELKPGMLVTVPGANGLPAVSQVLAMQDQPVTRDQARGAIERFLANEHRNETLQAAVKKLHEQARISYLGEFDPAKSAPAAKSDGAPAAKPDAAPAAAAPAPAAATAAPASPAGVSEGSMNKGISGLK